MDEKIVKDLDKLKASINKLRDILNEMCYSINETESSIERLVVSRQLDQLIVEYMRLKKLL